MANPYDNALAESFVAALKTECFAISLAPTKAAVKLMIFDYIKTFYYTRRRQRALGYRSPAQFEKDWLCSQGEGFLAAAARAARPASKDRSALSALAVNNSPELFNRTVRCSKDRHANLAPGVPHQAGQWRWSNHQITIFNFDAGYQELLNQGLADDRMDLSYIAADPGKDRDSGQNRRRQPLKTNRPRCSM